MPITFTQSAADRVMAKVIRHFIELNRITRNERDSARSTK